MITKDFLIKGKYKHGCSVESVFVPNNRRGYEMLDKFYLLAEEENRQDWLVY